ncbi:hypothetical protein C6506_29030, partial [Escherichia coli]
FAVADDETGIDQGRCEPAPTVRPTVGIVCGQPRIGHEPGGERQQNRCDQRHHAAWPSNRSRRRLASAHLRTLVCVKTRYYPETLSDPDKNAWLDG